MRHRPYGPYERYIKRPLDCVLAALLLILLSPVMGVLALLVRAKLGAPVIFHQERPGRDERIFRLCKFRTMTDARDERGELLSDSERLTPFGRRLRETSLDELPELWNVLKGDMALVGPRPLLVQYLPAYTARERHRHDVRPGITGLAQINGRNFLPWDRRLALDVEYAERITFFGDLRIVAMTVWKVLRREDVASSTEEIDEGDLDEIRGVAQERSE
jgi:lipopolysaccharide/colanic/teichoic acid biosynthesis glycosyltransferase